MRSFHAIFFAVMIGILLPCATFAADAPSVAGQTVQPDPAGIEFFEAKIRPVLAEKCFKCHSAQSAKLKGGLYLDSRDGVLLGGDSGEPAVVPGHPEKSNLIEAIRYTNEDTQMPPKEQLPANQVADFEAWVRMGAPDPRTQMPATQPAGIHRMTLAEAREFWSLKVPKMPALPVVADKGWAHNDLDLFILAKLNEKGLKPSPPADKRTLIRRASFDLIGLPPTQAEVDAFEADKSPDAFAKVVDRLLASPHYGERWARYWLDIARYADTKGYVFKEERRYPYAYTYRDWVIRAFNADVPYDRFLMLQLAADKMDLGGDTQGLAAMGFLTVGRRFLNQQQDIIDDRIDVISRGTMGLTVACARCHDHKFDAIPTKDYYSLYGVFASSREPKELPSIAAVEKSPQVEDFEKQHQAIQAEMAAFSAKRHGEILAQSKTPALLTEYLLAASEPPAAGQGEARIAAMKRGLNPYLVRQWRTALQKRAAGDAVFGLWRALAALPENQFAAKAPAVIAAMKPPANTLVLQAMSAKPPPTLREAAERYASLLLNYDKPDVLPDPSQEVLRRVLRGPDAPANVPLADAEQLFQRDDKDKLNAIQVRLDKLKATHPGSPPRAMVMEDVPNPMTPRVLLRGNAGSPGEAVPRQFLTMLSPDVRKPFTQGSGRLELAQAIASRDNPLTARVIVNRVWLHHFGFGLVRTPSEFGSRGELPSHPELLDYLAVRFMDDPASANPHQGMGWSIKKLHRLILLSATWQQSSDTNPEGEKADPENRLVWRFNRQRLDFESMRDSLLAATGGIDGAMFGRSIDLLAPPFSRRRSVYGFIDRQNLPNLFRTFDFASPDTTSPQRYFTTVPQQALFMMNSPFAIEQARALAARPELAAIADPEKKIAKLYEIAYARQPTPRELSLGLQFVQNELGMAAVPPAAPAWQYGTGYYDETGRRVVGFQRFTVFVKGAWHAGPKLPDPKAGYASLSAGGGHPGDDPQHAVVRRWTAPRDGVVSIDAALGHAAQPGDGVRGRIVSSRTGELASRSVHASQAKLHAPDVAVKQGDTIDLIVDCLTGPNADSFSSSMTIRMTGASDATEGPAAWNSEAEFSGPRPPPPPSLSPWEKYAQVLLEANEFVFVD